MFTTGKTVGLAEWIIDDTCLVFLRIKPSRKCLIWRKGDRMFQELPSRASLLPRPVKGQNAQFDFQHVINDSLYYRPWGSDQFWKGTIGYDNKIVWEQVRKKQRRFQYFVEFLSFEIVVFCVFLRKLYFFVFFQPN